MHALLKEFTEIVPPPGTPLDVTSRHESITGLSLELPSDYLEFIRLYGPGDVCAGSIPFLKIDTIMECLGDVSFAKRMYNSNRTAYDESFRNMRPATAACPLYIAWGTDDCGISYGWAVDVDSGTWIGASEGEFDIHLHDCTMLELLLMIFRTGLPDNSEAIGYCEGSGPSFNFKRR